MGIKFLVLLVLVSPGLCWIDDVVLTTLTPFRNELKGLMTGLMGSSTISPQAEYITCDLCITVLPIAKQLIADLNKENLVKLVIQACKILGFAPQPDICDFIIPNYADQFLYIVENLGNTSASDFCTVLNPGCRELSSEFTTWDIRIDGVKPPITDVLPVPEGSRMKMIQFTDIHLDLDYKEGTLSNCGDGMPICCREEYGNGTSGMFGEWNCALPYSSLNALYTHAATHHSDARVVFLTGDYVHSGVWLYSIEENGRHVLNATASLTAAFAAHKHVTILPLSGNHEPQVVNMYAPPELWDQFDVSWVYKTIAGPVVARDSSLDLSEFERNGYYTAKVDGVRIVAINTNLCYVQNFWLPLRPGYIMDQLQWIHDRLFEAERYREPVYIIGHVQPEGCWPVWSSIFHKIVNRFEATIRGMFFGHSHKPQFRLAFEKDTLRPTAVSYIAGSALTDSMNPSYAVYEVDGNRGKSSTYNVMSQTLVSLNLKRSNERKEPVISELVNTHRDLGLKDLTPTSIFQFANSIICDHNTWQKYVEFHTKGADTPEYENYITNNNASSTICSIVSSDSADHSQCEKISEIVNTTVCQNNQPTTTQTSYTPKLSSSLFITITFTLTRLSVGLFSQ